MLPIAVPPAMGRVHTLLASFTNTPNTSVCLRRAGYDIYLAIAEKLGHAVPQLIPSVLGDHDFDTNTTLLAGGRRMRRRDEGRRRGARRGRMKGRGGPRWGGCRNFGPQSWF